MTVQSDNNKNTYVGNGSTRVFTITFPTAGIVASEVLVYITDVNGLSTLITTNYTLDLNALTVEYPVTGAALTASEKIVILRSLPLTQESDLKNQGNLDSEGLETSYDRITYMIQQLQETLDRVPQGDVSADEFDTAALIASMEALRDEAQASADASDASADESQAYALAAQGTSGTFVNADLVAGILTITHTLGLSAPYILDFSMVDNNNQDFEPDDITFGENIITIDLSSYGTIVGTWGYIYGGSPNSQIPLPDPTGQTVGDLLRINAAQDAYELHTPVTNW